MCMIGLVKCVWCKKKINALNLLISHRDERPNDWPIGKVYTCPECGKKFIVKKVTIYPSIWEEEKQSYKCTCAIPTFIKGDKLKAPKHVEFPK